LRPRLQAAAEDAVANVLNQPGDPEAALVAIEPSTGEVVAMVGGRDWTKSQVNLALGVEGGGSGRQPGSSFKPIVAAAAMEEGISLGTHYSAGPASFLLPDGSTWTVRNSEGTSGGTLPLDEAMVRSVNGVYARLTLDVTAPRVIQQAHYMGVKSHLKVYPAVGLGGMEVSALDMASAYATLANDGTAIEPTTIHEIVLANGEVMHPKQRIVPQAVSPGNAYLLTKVLEQVVIRGTGKAAAIGRPVAGKTGTTNNYTDAWFVGYTPDLAVAVWVGYPQGLIPMLSVHGIRVFGGTFPAMIFKEFMTVALANKPVSKFKLPKADLVRVMIDPITGLLAAPWCPGELKTMLRQLAPKDYCPPPPPAPIFTPSPVGTATPSPGASPSPTDGKGDPSPSPTKKGNGPSPEPSPEPSPTKN
jgi:penicillin-binding protein 1A